MVTTVEKENSSRFHTYKTAGSMLLKSALKARRACSWSSKKPDLKIYDFESDLLVFIKIAPNCLDALNLAFSRVFRVMRRASHPDLYFEIGRLDGVVVSLVDAFRSLESYRFDTTTDHQRETTGLKILKEAYRSLLDYATDAEENLGRELIDLDRRSQATSDESGNEQCVITIRFDVSKSIDNLRRLFEWYDAYKRYLLDISVTRQPGDPNIDSIEPVDAAVMGYAIGLKLRD